jgi:hypothetical protein
MRTGVKSALIGVAASVLLFLVFGIPTDLVPNRFYTRMLPASILDYVFLVATSVMLGGYIGLHFYRKSSRGAKGDLAAMGGGVTGLFAFGCPICNAVLVSLVGTGALLTYYEPVRPAMGVLGVGILGTALYLKLRDRGCQSCEGDKGGGGNS